MNIRRTGALAAGDIASGLAYSGGAQADGSIVAELAVVPGHFAYMQIPAAATHGRRLSMQQLSVGIRYWSPGVLLIVLSQSRRVAEYQSRDGEISTLAALGKPRLIEGC